MFDRGSSALRWAGTGQQMPGVWVRAAGRADGRNFDRKLYNRA